MLNLCRRPIDAMELGAELSPGFSRWLVHAGCNFLQYFEIDGREVQPLIDEQICMNR